MKFFTDPRNRLQRIGILLLIIFCLYMILYGDLQKAFEAFVAALITLTLADLKVTMRKLVEREIENERIAEGDASPAGRNENQTVFGLLRKVLARMHLHEKR